MEAEKLVSSFRERRGGEERRKRERGPEKESERETESEHNNRKMRVGRVEELSFASYFVIIIKQNYYYL